MAHDQELPPNVLAALQRGESIEAIKLLRSQRNLGLKEAKELLDAHQHGSSATPSEPSMSSSLPPAVIEAMQRGRKIEAIRLLRAASGMGLKEAKEAVEALGPQANSGVVQPGTGNKFIWLVLLGIAAFMAYQWLSSSS